MTKHFGRCIAGMMMVLISVMTVDGASDSNGKFIYYLGDANNWVEPLADNAAEFENYKLYETSPGSNVYAGHMSSMSQWGTQGWFRFYSELNEKLSDQDYGSWWKRNVIAPARDNYLLSPDKLTHVLTADRVDRYEFMQSEPGSWVVPNGEYTLVVNLNNSTVSAFTGDEIFMVMEGQQAPTVENYAGYRNASSRFYADAGKLSFNFYGMLRGEDSRWISPADQAGCSIPGNVHYEGELSSSSSSDRGQCFAVKDWQGGVVTLSERYGSFWLELDPDDDAPVNRDVLYLFTPSDILRPWEGASNAVCGDITVLSLTGDGSYEGELDVASLAGGFNFGYKLGEKGEPAREVLCPANGKNLDLCVADDKSFSSAKLAGENEAGLWFLPKERIEDGGNVKVTVKLGSSPSLSMEFPKAVPYQPSGMYMRGGMNDWTAPEEWEFVTTPVKNKWILIDKTIPAGTQFKIADMMWGDINLGGDLNNPYVWVNTPLNLDGSMNPPNLSLMQDFHGDVILSFSEGVYSLLLKEPGEGMEGIENPDSEKGLYIYDPNRDQMRPMTFNNVTGMYMYNSIYIPAGESADLHIFTRKLPITSIEPEWASTSSVSALTDGFRFEFDEFCVAEAEVTVNSGDYHPLTIYNDGSESPYFVVNVDLEQSKIYIERGNSRLYLCGKVSGNVDPTLKNRAAFKNLSIPYSDGGVVDLPAGDIEFIFVYGLSNGEIPPYSREAVISPDESGVATSDDQDQYAWGGNKLVSLKGWKGGKALLSLTRFLDLSKFTTVMADLYDGEIKHVPLTAVQPGSAVYSGMISYEGDTNELKELCFSFMASENIIGSIGLPFYARGTGGVYYNVGKDKLVDSNGRFSAPLGFSGISYLLPTLKGAAQLDVTVDLENGTLDMEIVSGQTAMTYETVSDDGSGLDGIIAYPSSTEEDAVIVEAPIDIPEGGDNEISFNFTTPDGDVITPSTGEDTEIVFDANGYWEGGIAHTGASSSNRRIARAQAMENARWHFRMPEEFIGTTLNMMVDEKNGKIKVFSSAHNNNFFIIMDPDNGGFNSAVIEKFDALKENMLLESSAEGIYEGVMEIKDDTRSVNFISSLYSSSGGMSGIGMFYYDPSLLTFDLTSGDTEKSVFALSVNEWGSRVVSANWLVNAPVGEVYVTFDSNADRLTLSLDKAGVENVSADTASDSGVEVVPGEGCIIVTTSEPTRVAVYSVTGMLVADRSVSSGSTVIGLPAGYYITAGKKLLVR